MYVNMHTGGEMGMVVGSPKSKARARVYPQGSECSQLPQRIVGRWNARGACIPRVTLAQVTERALSPTARGAIAYARD